MCWSSSSSSLVSSSLLVGKPTRLASSSNGSSEQEPSDVVYLWSSSRNSTVSIFVHVQLRSHKASDSCTLTRSDLDHVENLPDLSDWLARVLLGEKCDWGLCSKDRPYRLLLPLWAPAFPPTTSFGGDPLSPCRFGDVK